MARDDYAAGTACRIGQNRIGIDDEALGIDFIIDAEVGSRRPYLNPITDCPESAAIRGGANEMT